VEETVSDEETSPETLTIEKESEQTGTISAGGTSDTLSDSSGEQSSVQNTLTDNKEKKSMDWIIAVLIVLIVLMVALIVFAVMSIRKNNRYNRRLEQRERRHREDGIESAHTQHSGRESGNGYNKGINDEVPKRKKH
jgi:flagellar biosynthesis/type III secretory pathway M-ring protein FliF/YscJ